MKTATVSTSTGTMLAAILPRAVSPISFAMAPPTMPAIAIATTRMTIAATTFGR